MASQQNDVYADNPDVVGTAAGQHDKIRIERAPDNAGVPGNFAQIAEVSANPNDEYTKYTDTGGEDTSWYRWRWFNSVLATLSNPSAALNAGDSLVRQRLQANLPDEDVSVADLNRWLSQMLIDLYVLGIWKHDRAVITPSTASDGTVDEWYDIPGRIRDVTEVEVVSTDANRRHVTWLRGGEWRQIGRQIRFTRPRSATFASYQIHGKRQFRSVGEMTDDYFNLAELIVVRFAFRFREWQRANFYKFILFDKTTDISRKDIAEIRGAVYADIQEQARALAWPEPEVAMGWGH